MHPSDDRHDAKMASPSIPSANRMRFCLQVIVNNPMKIPEQLSAKSGFSLEESSRITTTCCVFTLFNAKDTWLKAADRLVNESVGSLGEVWLELVTAMEPRHVVSPLT